MPEYVTDLMTCWYIQKETEELCFIILSYVLILPSTKKVPVSILQKRNGRCETTLN